MSRYASPDHNPPLLWLRGHAVYTAHFIVLVFVASMLITTICMAARVALPFTWLPFISEAVLRGEVWRLVTYGLVNPPSLGFVLGMFMLGWFGRELEKHFGRRTFLWLYAGVYLVTPLLFTLIGAWLPLQLSGESGAFALFIAYATLHPNLPFFFNILAKWLALVLVGIYTLIALSNRDLSGLVSLWATVGYAHGFVRFQQGRFTLPRPSGWFKRPKLRVLPDLPPEPPVRPRSAPTKSMAEMDALLDKIAQSGIGSLTAKERARLEQSRAELLKQRGAGGGPA
jgi:membrane associated rhomboid family serine protease